MSVGQKATKRAPKPFCAKHMGEFEEDSSSQDDTPDVALLLKTWFLCWRPGNANKDDNEVSDGMSLSSMRSSRLTMQKSRPQSEYISASEAAMEAVLD
ncbi:hypothetical protein Tco_0516432 [Tanacetum coccineum]